MNDKAIVQNSRLDVFKWGLVGLVLAAGVLGNFYLSDISVTYRFIGVTGLLVIAAGLASMTAKGRDAWQFLQDARAEVRKMVWPTRQETSQTTLIVVVAVLVMGLFVWIVDTILFKLMQFFTG